MGDEGGARVGATLTAAGARDGRRGSPRRWRAFGAAGGGCATRAGRAAASRAAHRRPTKRKNWHERAWGGETPATPVPTDRGPNLSVSTPVHRGRGTDNRPMSPTPCTKDEAWSRPRGVLAQLLCGVDAMPAEIRRIYARGRAPSSACLDSARGRQRRSGRSSKPSRNPKAFAPEGAARPCRGCRGGATVRGWPRPPARRRERSNEYHPASRDTCRLPSIAPLPP